jgi:pilus assembly protein CpaB
MAKRKLLVAAVVVGIFAAALVYFAIQQQNQKQKQLLANQVKVVKAARNIPAGTPLNRDHVTIDKVPKQFLPHNALLKTDVEVYLGQPLKNSVKESSMIVTGDFEVAEVNKDLASKIPEGERAMAVPVDDISGVSGLLKPGDRVDILGTFPVSGKDQVVPEAGRGSSNGYMTMTLLQNVTLLAVGKQATRATGQKARRGMGYSSVTMSVTVEEAELLTIAQERGDLMLLLRNPNDVKIDQIKRKTLRGVLENLEVINEDRKERVKERRTTPEPKEKDDEIEIITGD